MRGKRWRAAVLSAVLALTMTACGTNPAEQAGSTAETAVPAESDAQDGSGTACPSDGGEEETSWEAVPSETPSQEQKPESFVPDETVPSVSFSRESGLYADAFELQLSSEGNRKIYYTLDGSDPMSSPTAILYQREISVDAREDAPNVVTAVEPVLFSGSYNQVNRDRNGFTCDMPVPREDEVDKCTVIRAVAAEDDGRCSPEAAAVYFVGSMEEHIQGIAESCEAAGTSLAVISIAMDYGDLFDSEKGIYVKGDIFQKALEEYLKTERLKDAETARSLDANYKQKGRAWEREASVAFFECDADGAQEVFSQNCGIRVQGNYSRSDLQKGFRLYARADYGDNNFRYAVFGEDYRNEAGEVMDKFKTLVLRAGGNCAFTAKYNDTYWQSLLGDTDCGTLRSRPCVVYLNGEYWGLYVLQEDYSDDFFEDKYGVDKNDVVVYKGDAEALALGYKLDEGSLPEGETDESFYFRELLDFFETHQDLKDPEDYAAFQELVDPQSVLDYFAVECWINNKWDWPGKNWSMWRTAGESRTEGYGDNRWRFLFYDMEFGGVSGGGDASVNTIREDNYKPQGLLDRSTDNPAVLCFAWLMTNAQFRTAFYERLSGLTDGLLEKEKALARLDELEGIYGPLLDQFFTRFPNTGSRDNAINGGYASSRCIRDFIQQRGKYVQKMIDYCETVLGE